jgi:hypothetical integral membrane protein (TIGR02206 family)
MTHRSLFGPAHIAWILGIALASAWLASLCRQNRIPQRALRTVLACLLVGCEVERYIQDGVRWPHGLPIQLCSVTAWFAVAACITLAPLAAEYVYFVGISGAGMAVITPDMGTQWPPRFFLTHGVLIATACVLTFGRLAPLRRGAMWRAYGLFFANTVFIGIFDWTFKTNYWYLRGKPASMTAFDWMGPWPVYILSVALFALVLFALLWAASRLSMEQPAMPKAQAPLFHPQHF